MSAMRALVTGAAGLVGSAIVDAAGATGLDVLAIGRDRDLSVVGALDGLPAVDAVLHAAARLPASYAPDDPAGDVNRAIDDVVLAYARRHGAAVVFASTAALYAALDTPIAEDAALDVRGSYLEAKATTEDRGARAGVAFASLRLTSPYGPGLGARNVLGRFVEEATAGRPFGWMGEGAREQDFTYVADIADAFVRAIGSAGVYNVAAGAPTTMRELAELVAQEAGNPGLARPLGGIDPQDGRRARLDISKAAADLSWTPMTPLRHGIRALLAVA
jgi:nucleoside-diphosphate-sugar epimerase